MWPFDRKLKRLERQIIEEVLRFAEQDSDVKNSWDLLQSMKMEGETPQNRVDIIKACRILAKVNPHARGLLRTYVKYICRGGFKFDALNKADADKFNAWAEVTEWPARQKQIILRTIRDGECLIWWQTADSELPDDSELKPRFLDPIKINNNHADTPQKAIDGIFVDEADPEIPMMLYHEDFGAIPAADVSWYRSDGEIGATRAWPWFVIVANNAKSYAAWLADRIRLNRLRTAVAMIRKHPNATTAQVQKWLATQKNTTSQTTDSRSDNSWLSQERWHGAQIFDLKGEEDIDFKAPNLGAGDAQTDGRALLLTLSAATGLAEFMTTGDAGNNNYASALVAEAPSTAEFEDWQLYFAARFKCDWFRVMEWLDVSGWAPERDLARVTVQAPRLISRDKGQETNSNNTLHDSKVISLAEWRRREGVEGEQMDEELDDEASNEILASGNIDSTVHGTIDPETGKPIPVKGVSKSGKSIPPKAEDKE
jgi:hypothetical protein